MHDALDVGPGRVDGGVEGEASLVYAQIRAASVYDLTLKVDLHLRTQTMLINTSYDCWLLRTTLIIFLQVIHHLIIIIISVSIYSLMSVTF